MAAAAVVGIDCAVGLGAGGARETPPALEAPDSRPQHRAPTLEAQADRTAAFDIPAQPLALALTAFGRQSGLQIAVDRRQPPESRAPASAAP
jgi:hypothetical protein